MHSTDKKSKTEKRTEKQTLVKELKELLSSVEGQKLPLATILARYFQHFGRLLKIGDYGARRLEDLIQGLPSLQVGTFSFFNSLHCFTSIVVPDAELNWVILYEVCMWQVKSSLRLDQYSIQIKCVPSIQSR